MADERDIITVPVEGVRLHKRRCFGCGRWWAYETFNAGEPQCPVCAGKLIDRMRGEVAKLTRGRAALKGAVRRKAKRGGRPQP